jgi:NADH-quinone oxidoreductase subunit J
MDFVVFTIAAIIIVGGALGVVLSGNPVHSALALVGTLFGIAVLFVQQEAHFLAAVQVIVYAGAIVVLFLFVIMLLGVDESEDLSTDPLAGQRPAAAALGLAALGLTILVLLGSTDDPATGARHVVRALDESKSNIEQLAELLFTRYLFAFEITSLLLVIAVVAAVVLARRPSRLDLEAAAEAADADLEEAR